MAFLFVGLYIGWVFYSRWEANQTIADKAAERKRAQDQQTFEAMGGNLSLVAEFPDREPVVLSGIADEDHDPKPPGRKRAHAGA